MRVRRCPRVLSLCERVRGVGRWLDREHPDPAGRNMRELWLPALEWYYSERVRGLCDMFGEFVKPTDSKSSRTSGEELSDEAVLAAADFAIFIE